MLVNICYSEVLSTWVALFGICKANKLRIRRELVRPGSLTLFSDQLPLQRPERHTLQEIPLENKEHNKHRHGHNHAASHQQAIVRFVRALEGCQCNRERAHFFGV